MKSEAHLKFIRQLSCLICGNAISTEAAHVRMSCLRIAKTETGHGRKPSDAFTVPLCSLHHRQQHTRGEAQWWSEQRVDPILTSLALWEATGDYERCEQIVAMARAI